MINLLYTLLLAIYFCILIYGTKLGLSVILFMIPLIFVVYKTLKKNNKLNNKKGLILLLPILLLSTTYFLFDNMFFKILNIFVITGLFLLFYIMTIRPTFHLYDIIADCVCILLSPMDHIKDITTKVKEFITKKLKIKSQTFQKVKSYLLIIPIIIIVIILLSSADQVFYQLIDKILEVPTQLTSRLDFKEFILRIVMIILFFFYFSATLFYLIINYEKEERYDGKKISKKKPDSIRVLLISLNIIYLVFDIIQIKSLFFHSLDSNFTYAEYARRGFFQLLIVSFINLCVILYTKKYKPSKKIKALTLCLVLSTFLIIISSFYRMYLYEQEYGYTLLRLLVYITLFTETICLIPTIMYIIKEKFPIVKSYLIIIITIYTIINFINIDKLIAVRNIDRYEKKKDIDLYYLMNNHADNIPELVDFLEEVEDDDIDVILTDYLEEQNFKTNDIRDWNLSKQIANNKLEKRK